MTTFKVTDLNKFGNLKIGSKAGHVKNLQSVLLLAGEVLPVYGVDGYFGRETDAAVRSFQRKHMLTPDGIAGPKTLYELMWYKYPNFVKEEFECKCGGKYCNGFPVRVDEALVSFLQEIRDHYDRPVTITSGIRCPQHNRNVDGSLRSQHTIGTAADFKVPGISATSVYVYADLLVGRDGGVGRYNTFTHIDTRGTKARWDHR